MNVKTIILVIIISILIGGAIYWFALKPKAAAITTQPREVPKSTESMSIPSPSPLPSQPPIDKNSKLSTEIESQTSPDFSEDYKNLKDQVNQSF
jgi:hypothetical protein